MNIYLCSEIYLNNIYFIFWDLFCMNILIVCSIKPPMNWACLVAHKKWFHMEDTET